MKKNLNLLMLLAIIILAACQKEVPQQTSGDEINSFPMAKAGGTTTQKDVFVSVTVNNNGIVDGDGRPYIHNQEKVQAVIWAAGEFFMNTNTTSNKSPIRKMYFNITPVTPASRINLNDVNNVRMRVVKIEGGTRLQDIQPGELKKARFWFWGEKPMGVFVWKLYYRGNNLFENSETVEVTVSRNLNGSWSIKSDGDGKALLRDANDYNIGYYLAPFELTITPL
jgi:hypothetical protein